MPKVPTSRVVSGNLAALVLVCVGCGGRQPDTSIPLDESRVLNGEITASFSRVMELLATTTDAARELGTLPSGISADDFDVALVREVMEDCFTDAVQMLRGADPDDVPNLVEALAGSEGALLSTRGPVGRIEPCEPSRIVALESYLGVVPPEVSGFIVGRVLDADEVRVTLKDVLVGQLDALEAQRIVAQAESVALRRECEDHRANASDERVPDTTRRQVEVDYESAIRELDAVDAVLAQIEEQLADMRQLRRVLVEQAAESIAAFGTPE